MTVSPEFPPQPLTAEDIADFRRDGAIRIRQLYSPKWLELMTSGIEEVCSRDSPFGNSGAKFRSDAFTWLTVDKIRDFVLEGPTAHVAQQVFGSRKVNFFYDQIFVKRQLTPDRTPWHHDFTFWPLAGSQIASVWASVDAVTPESSGLEFIAGSHLWPQRFKAVGTGGVVLSTEPLQDLPDFERHRDRHRVLSWDLEPGDALLFHALTVHGSRGNTSSNSQRRAITTRWCGDDVVYHPRGKQMPIPWKFSIQPGEGLSGAIFPQVLPEILESEVAARLQGPVFPDPDKARAAMQQVATAERVAVES